MLEVNEEVNKLVKKENLEEEFKGDSKTIEWLRACKDSTRYTYKSAFKYFLEYIKLTGEQIIEDRKNDTEGKWERTVLAFRQYMLNKGFSENTARSALTACMSFFTCYQLDLRMRKKIPKAKRVTNDYKLTKDTLAKMWIHANLKEKWVLCNKSFGLRASDFIRLTKGFFSSINLDGEIPIDCGTWNTIKENIDAHLFLDADALTVVKEYLSTVMKDKDAKDRMLNIRKEELSVILQTLAKKANIELGDKTLRFHCLRKFLASLLSSVTSESKWKQILGKTVSEDAYVSDEELRENFKKVLPLISINGNTQNHIALDTLQKQVETLEQWCGELARQLIKDNPTVGLENATIQYLATKGKK